jgi:hypothetical protein
MSRVLSVARVHLLSRMFLAWPWAILASSFAINLVIFGSLGSAIENHTSGGLASIYIVMMIFGGGCVAQMFPYMIGLSVSRRSFYLATSLVTAGLSIAYGIGIYLLSLIEGATGGWGIGLHFFDLGFLSTGNPATQVLVYIGPFLALGFLGMFLGAIHRRWGMNGIFVLCIAAIVVLGGTTALLAVHNGWAPLGHWFAGQSTLAVIAGWPVVIAVLFAVAGYLPLRHATA